MVAGGLLLMGVGLWFYMANRATAPALPRVGAKLSEFHLSDLHGRPVNLKDYAGQTLILNFWATWCPPCRDEMPMLVEYYDQSQPEGALVLAVNVGETAIEASAFAQDYNMSFPVLLDGDSAYFDSLLFDSLPTTILVGPDGTVRALHVGYMSPEIFQSEILAQIPR
jgi:thiol-disulfide isomerase/thioredoxin